MFALCTLACFLRTSFNDVEAPDEYAFGKAETGDEAIGGRRTPFVFSDLFVLITSMFDIRSFFLHAQVYFILCSLRRMRAFKNYRSVTNFTNNVSFYKAKVLPRTEIVL